MNYRNELNRRTLLKVFAAMGAAAALPSSLIAAPRSFDRAQTILSGLVEFGLPCAMGGIDTGNSLQIVAAGHLDFDSTRVPDAHSLWRLYSMTKPIVGITTMVLVGEGKLGLDQHIGDILPEFARPMVMVDQSGSLQDVRPAKRPITVRQLLTHTSGHASMITGSNAVKKAIEDAGLRALPVPRAANPPAGLSDFVRRLAKLPLMAEPGTQYNYSYGLDVLGRLIEVVEGKPFEAVLQEKLFGPLGMYETFFQVPKTRAADMVTMIEFKDGKSSRIDPGLSSAWLNPPPYPSGGGGLVSSAHDYHRFLAMLAGEGTLDGIQIMSAEVARLAMSDLLDPSIDRKRIAIPGIFGFGAGGVLGGPGLNRDCFGWWGAAGTLAWVDRRTKLCGTMWQQFFPPTAIFQQPDFCRAIYADLGLPTA